MSSYDFNELSAEATANANVYNDPTRIMAISEELASVGDATAIQLAEWLRQKKYGADVREAIARSVLYHAMMFHRASDQVRANTNRQEALENRQREIETQFKEIVSAVTSETELILARNSERYGSFNVLDDRLENLERLVSQYVPEGFQVNITHNLSRRPTVTATRYQYAIGTEPDGLGTGPSGTFGGQVSEAIPVSINYNGQVAEVSMPASYKMAGTFTIVSPTVVLLIDGLTTIKFEVEGGAVSAVIKE
ncbi:TPA: hypothetical protein ACGO3A_001996 [Streptococcus suis]